MTVSEEMKKKNDAGAETADMDEPKTCGDENTKASGEEAGKSSGADEADDAGKEAEETENGKADAAEESEDGSGEVKEAGEDEALMERYTRLMADFQNYKRRTEKEKNDIYAYANEKLILGLLEVIDNFERAVLSETADEKYAEGMEMIFRQLKSVLEKAGLEEIKALGEGFDPNFHNAVMTEDNDKFDSGSVTEVLQKGYTLNGKVIRPSMVKVNN